MTGRRGPRKPDPKPKPAPASPTPRRDGIVWPDVPTLKENQ